MANQRTQNSFCFYVWNYCYCCLTVCHVRALCSNGWRYRQDFFCLLWQLHVSPRSCRNLAYIVLPLPPQILFQNDPLLLIWASDGRRHSMANFARMLRDIAMVTMDIGQPILNHHRSFEWCHRWLPTTSFSPKWGFQMHQKFQTTRRVLPFGEFDRKAN